MGNLILYGTSGICWLVGLILPGNWALAICALPFWLLLCAVIHESGHILGCRWHKTPVTEICTPLFLWNGQLRLRKSLRPDSYCCFPVTGNPRIYLWGPGFSTALWLLVWIAFLLSDNPCLLLGSIVTFVVAVGNWIPWKSTDMAQFLSARTK